MNKHYFIFPVLFLIFLVQNCTNSNQKENKTSIIKRNRVFLKSGNDTINLGEFYSAEIHIPDYDSLGIYSCFVGNYELKVNNKDTILQMVSKYDSLYSSRVPGIYYIQTKASKTGILRLTGFIRKTIQGKTTYFPFKDSCYVK